MQALPHAVIVAGPPGSNFDHYLEAYISDSDDILRIDEHPNQSNTSQGIYIGDIRNLQEIVRSAKRGARTIVVLADAAKMTHQAQNALLKLLEEPRPQLHFVLCTYTPMSLLDTVRSRCQMVTYVDTASSDIEIPAEKAARITFMASGVRTEMNRLATDSRYFDKKAAQFELAKKFIAGNAYERLVVVKEAGSKRETALDFINAAVVMYASLLKTRFSPKLRDEVLQLLEVEKAIKQNGNAKLQLLRCVL